MAKGKNKNSGTNNGLFKRWAQGRSFLTLDFFRRNGFYIIGITVLIMMNISKNRRPPFRNNSSGQRTIICSQ